MAIKKPEFREFDENPHRQDDVSITLPFFKFEGSGKLLTSILITVGLLLVGCGSLGYVWWHEKEAQRRSNELAVGMMELTNTVRTQICVLTLNEVERKEYRLEGKYCSGWIKRGEPNGRKEPPT